MEPPPPHSSPSATVTTVEAPPPRLLQPPTNLNSWENPPLSKLRLMCSYGGHIVPRPHGKSLCYMGGDTRMIVMDRCSSLSSLHHRLSKTLLNNQPFTLKYQLPNEDLDSLISVASDEDLENMVEEYDRLNNYSNSRKGSGCRLRLFLFPKSSISVDQLLVIETNSSEDWFLNALNGEGGNLSTASSTDVGFSINNLLGLDDDDFGKKAGAMSMGNDIEAQLDGSKNEVKDDTCNQDVHSIPDSPMVETSSSFGSTSSSPLGPTQRVFIEENQKLGVEERFQQMNFRVVAGVTLPQKQGGSIELPSLESVSSEGTETNPLSEQTQRLYQEPIVQIQSVNDRMGFLAPMQPQDEESAYVLMSSQFDKNHQPQQFLETHAAGTQYIPAGATSIPSSYYHPIMYTLQQHQQRGPQQYPVYFLPARPTQAYNLPVQQPNYSEIAPAAAPLSHSQTQYVAFTKIHHQSQSEAVNSNCAHEYAGSQVYYTQPLPPQLASHYQTSTQLPTENTKQQRN